MPDCFCAAPRTDNTVMTPFIQHAIECGNIEYFKDIKDEKRIKKISQQYLTRAESTGGFFSYKKSINYCILSYASKHSQNALCKFFLTDLHWNTHTKKLLTEDLEKSEKITRLLYQWVLYNDKPYDEHFAKFLEKILKIFNKKYIEKTHKKIYRLELFNEISINALIENYLDPSEEPLAPKI